MLPNIANSVASAVSDFLSESSNFREEKEAMRDEIARIRQKRQEASQRHAHEIKQLRQQIHSLDRSISDRRAQELPVHRYASELKDSNTPSHILLLQAQVCRQVHSMCVDSVQLQLLENTKNDLLTLARDQQREQLQKLLWFVESKTELLQQQEDDLYDINRVGEEEDENGIDNLLKNINVMKLQKKHEDDNVRKVSPNLSIEKDDFEWQELTVEDLKMDKAMNPNDTVASLFQDGVDVEESMHKSLPTIREGLSSDENKSRTTALIETGTWNSEKPGVSWG